MIIIAKFASTCPNCAKAIAIGTKVEWTKGSKAAHVDCSAALPGLASTTPSSTVCKCGRAKQAKYATCYGCSSASKTCRSCGHVERRNARGYVEGDWVRGGKCQSCREERAMGY